VAGAADDACKRRLQEAYKGLCVSQGKSSSSARRAKQLLSALDDDEGVDKANGLVDTKL